MTFIIDDLLAALNAAKTAVEDSRPCAPFHSITFEGRTIVLKAMPGRDIDGIADDTDYGWNNELGDDATRRMLVEHVASWILVDEVIDGGRRFTLYDGRAIINADGSNRAILDIFMVALEVVPANQ